MDEPLGSFCVVIAKEKIMTIIEREPGYPFKIWMHTQVAFKKIDSPRYSL